MIYIQLHLATQLLQFQIGLPIQFLAAKISEKGIEFKSDVNFILFLLTSRFQFLCQCMYSLSIKIMTESSECTLIQNFKNSISRIQQEVQQLEEDRINSDLINRLSFSKLEDKYHLEKSYYDQSLSEKDNKLKEIELTCKKIYAEEGERLKKENRKYMEILSEKEGEINALRKQNTNIKNKVANLETQMVSVVEARNSLQLFTGKTLQQLKSSFKELSVSMDDLDLQKMVMQSKCRQAIDKLDIVGNESTQVHHHNQMLQDKYQKLKASHQKMSKEFLEMKFELEKAHVQQHQESQMISCKSQKMGSSNDNLMETLLKEISAISALSTKINDKAQTQYQCGEYVKFSEQLIVENKQLKEKLAEQQLKINELEVKLNPVFQEELLRKEDPSLLEYLQKKQQQVREFEERLFQIEEYIQKKDECVDKILTEMESNARQGNEKIEQERDKLLKRNKYLQGEMDSLEKLCQIYKVELFEFVEIFEEGKRKKRKKKIRCQECLVPFESEEKQQKCEDCQKLFHCECISIHQCEKDNRKNVRESKGYKGEEGYEPTGTN